MRHVRRANTVGQAPDQAITPSRPGPATSGRTSPSKGTGKTHRAGLDWSRPLSPNPTHQQRGSQGRLTVSTDRFAPLAARPPVCCSTTGVLLDHRWKGPHSSSARSARTRRCTEAVGLGRPGGHVGGVGPREAGQLVGVAFEVVELPLAGAVVFDVGGGAFAEQRPPQVWVLDQQPLAPARPVACDQGVSRDRPSRSRPLSGSRPAMSRVVGIRST